MPSVSRIEPPAAMRYVGDRAWGQAPSKLTAEQVAQLAWRLQGELSDLSPRKGIEVNVPSFADACRVARALTSSQLKQLVFAPDRPWVAGCGP